MASASGRVLDGHKKHKRRKMKTEREELDHLRAANLRHALLINFGTSTIQIRKLIL
jgi:hypothetical protein